MSNEEQTQNPRGLPYVIPKMAGEIAHLDPGPAAALRRGPLLGAGAPAFWQLLVRYNPIGLRNESGWAAIIQSIAILTPKGNAPDKRSAHDPKRPMGRALHDAGLSELRLARLLSVAPVLRPELAVRTCRRFARTNARFDLVALGRFILFGDERTIHQIARHYYREEFRSKKQDKETHNV